MYFPDLLAEYKQLLQQMKADGVTSGDMYREVKQAIEWMETGYDPAEYRAATRIDAYVMDHHLMQDLISYVDSDCVTPHHIAEITHYSDVKQVERLYKIKRKVKKALAGLTDNERTVFILVRAERYSYTKVASVLGVSKSSVQVYLRRAEQKIRSNRKRRKKEPSAHTA
ncbi:sigma factor-like helix-turn-helix DNA-binding protein [Lysinibacillus sp. KU-BSD001]|uniref:sigma factor-like helix-turn-helix DNA-binding protein n=1 Tax=Lysinibacillus sp. KU-BSD001 TaxID=3141328 RepID=UPI0036EEE648